MLAVPSCESIQSKSLHPAAVSRKRAIQGGIAMMVHSAGGTVRALAQALAAGFERQRGGPVQWLEIDAAGLRDGRCFDASLLELADAAEVVLFAAPTYMGGPSAQFKAFADASSSRWAERRWQGKLAAGLTAGGSPNGEQSLTLQYFQALAAQHGMAWVPPVLIRDDDPLGRNRLGSALGVAATRDADGRLPDVELATAEAYGETLAQWLLRLRGGVAAEPESKAAALAVQAFDHLHVRVRDRVAAVAWYQRVMGLQVVESLRHWAVDGGPLTLGDAQHRVHLALFEGEPSAPFSTLALRVDAPGFLRWREHLQRELAEALPVVDHEQSLSLYFRDPDGNAYEITCYETTALQSALQSPVSRSR